MGRKQTAPVIIRENLELIRQAKQAGVTDKRIIECLGVSKSAYYRFWQENEDLWETVKNVRPQMIDELKAEIENKSFITEMKDELKRIAKKHTLKTRKKYEKVDKETGHMTEYTEVTEKEVDGNWGVLNFLLLNLERGKWSDNWQNYELKKQELELREKIAEERSF